ncbi:SRPBCC domain-containing protein [Clostridium saccharoperbutylacetonicum]|nr:SRPBCC domain-containing protein [Clostridium saccharoperbutylacetonicum]
MDKNFSKIINSTVDKVWTILTDFDSYPNWNPFIKYLKGTPKEGNKIEVKIVPPNSNGMIFKPTILKFTPNKELRWLGRLFIPGLFDGEHIFELISNNDGTTTLIQREKFHGILVPLLKNSLYDTKAGFDLMNKKIKEICEINL